MEGWRRALRADPAAMRAHPIATILERQDPAGFWEKPGAGYGSKYTGTVWSLMSAWPGRSSGRRAPSRATASTATSARAPPGRGSGVPRTEASRAHGGAITALRGLARVPVRRRSGEVADAIDAGVAFLLSRDPALADYPTSSRVSGSWFKLGFPSGYVADVLQNLEVLAELGRATDPRLTRALELVLSKQDTRARWGNEYAYNGKTWGDIERRGGASKWVTVRACTVVRAASG